MATGHAAVKAVLSGDTLVLVGNARPDGPPPELQVNLASLQAPRMGNPSKPDDPFAFASREFLRALCAGKRVRFAVRYRVEAIKRDFADVWLVAADGTEMLLNTEVARAGWAKLRTADREGKQVSSEYEEISRLLGLAEAEHKGVFTEEPGASEASVRKVQWNVDDAAALLAELKAESPVDAIVEMVRDGASLRCYLPARQIMINFNMAGVQAPRMNTARRAPPAAAAGDAEGKGSEDRASGAAAGGAGAGSAKPAASQPQPFAAEAKFFTERRLLSQSVKLHVRGSDKHSFFGTCEHPGGDIALELVKAGLANVLDWSVGWSTPADAAKYRASERAAKAATLRMWRDFKAAKITGAKEFSGVVVEVVSGDCLVVRLDETGGARVERKVYLSSIRCPRRGNPRKPEERDAPFYWASKEFMRKAAVGKRVNVSIEYERTLEARGGGGAGAAGGGGGGADQLRSYGTVTAAARKQYPNLAEALLAEGLCELVRHRKEDDRSVAYDALIAAETKAKAEKRNLWGSKPEEKGMHRVTDLVGKSSKAIEYLPFLQRARGHRAVVEYVFNGGRFKVYIPKENCAIAFALAGVRCPATARSGGGGRAAAPAEPYAQEAVDFARDHLLQQEVDLTVESMDKGGTALGELTFGSGSRKRSLALALVQQGLARVIPRAAEHLTNGTELMEAEAAAKGAQLRMWEGYKEPEPEPEAEGEAGDGEASATAAGRRKDTSFPVTVCDIVDGSHFFVQAESDAGKKATVDARLKALKEEVGTAAAPCEPRKGLLVCCLFDDGSEGAPHWFRAKVEAVVKGAEGAAPSGASSTYKVQYIDYGNRETVPITRLRPMDATISGLPPLARECVTAFLRVPALGEEYGSEAAACMQETVFGTRVLCRVHGKDEANRAQVTLFDAESGMSASEVVLGEGLARISKRETRRLRGEEDKKLVARLREVQESAKGDHFGMWRYGEVGDSDDEGPLGAVRR